MFSQISNIEKVSEPRLRIFINFALFGGMHIACARALFVKTEAPLCTAYRIAAVSFSLIAVLSVAHIVNLLFFSVDSVSMFSPTVVNPYVFFFSSMAQMSMSLAFMLLINTILANRLIALAATDTLTGL